MNRSLLSEPYVLNLDNTVKPLYGHQEGAELGYNPMKPGRPSHNYHPYLIGSLRVVLGADVMPGKQHGGKHSRPGLWRLIDSLPPPCRPQLIRGDISYGSERRPARKDGAAGNMLPAITQKQFDFVEGLDEWAAYEYGFW